MNRQCLAWAVACELLTFGSIGLGGTVCTWADLVAQTDVGHPGLASGLAPEQAVTELMDVISERASLRTTWEATETGPTEEQQARYSETAREIRELCAVLVEHGPAALPAMANGIRRGNEAQRLWLVNTVRRVAGDDATSVLIEAVTQAPSQESRVALNCLSSRTIRKELTPLELRVLKEKGGGTILARCVRAPLADRMDPLVGEFTRELLTPADLPDYFLGAYISPRMVLRQQYLLAFSYIGEPAVPRLTELRAAANGDEERRKWWTLALGYAGDASVTEAVKNVVLSDPDPYVRWSAVTSYVLSAKLSARPFLESLLNDATESEYRSDVMPSRRKMMLISGAAKDGLASLRQYEATGSFVGIGPVE